MRTPGKPLLIAAAVTCFAASLWGQSDDICREYGETPSREMQSRGRSAPYVFGRVTMKGGESSGKALKVTVIYSDLNQPAIRQVLGRSGNYCFRRVGTGGVLIVEVDGNEVVRRQISDLAATRHQEDFEVFAGQTSQTATLGVISAKFQRPPNEKTADLYRQAAQAERSKDHVAAVAHIREIVAIDTEDFIAWAKLGSLYIELNSLPDAAIAFRRAVAVRPDYTPALLNLGIVRALQGQYVDAIEIFKRAVSSDPGSSRGYRLLGEAYLQNRQGTLGLAALDKALELDPVGMAECHLLKARLYDLAGAKNLAAAEYKAFLKKVPGHTDKKTLEKYIQDNFD